MSGLFDKLAVPMFGLAAAVNGGCYDEAELVEFRTEPMVITEPGTYKVIPGDVFKGPLGVDFIVNYIYEAGEVQGSYIDEKNIYQFENIFSEDSSSIAFFGLNLLGEGNAFLKLTEKKELFDKCKFLSEKINQNYTYCSVVSPTEALDGESISTSETGYNGKLNTSEFPELLACAKNDFETAIKSTSKFTGLPLLTKGASSIYIIYENGVPTVSGRSMGNIILAQYVSNSESLNGEITSCKERIKSNTFRPGDHEVTHLFTNKFFGKRYYPIFFEEGFANYTARKLNVPICPWNEKDIDCLKENALNCLEGGYVLGNEIYAKGNVVVHPYKKYYEPINNNTPVFYSSECFWSKFVYLYGEGKIKGLYGLYKEMFDSNYFPEPDEEPIMFFQKNLGFINVDVNQFKEFGLGKQ